MPPIPLEWHGRDIVARFYASSLHGRRYDLVPTRANHQLAFGAYLRPPTGGIRHAAGLLVLTLSGDRICGLTRFENNALAWFGLPGRSQADSPEFHAPVLAEAVPLEIARHVANPNRHSRPPLATRGRTCTST